MPDPSNKFVLELVLSFFIALGVVVGGSLMSGLAAMLTGGLPLTTMGVVSARLKLWGTIAALGGSFATFRGLETGLFGGPIAFLAQIVFVVSAFTGGHLGHLLIRGLTGG